MPSSVELAPSVPVEASDAQAVQIEILEWGKYCSTENGPVLDQVEHGLLGTTSGFPQSLLAMCQPEDLGISKGQMEEEAQRLFEKVQWGTALRPVVIEGKVWSVLYRIGVRSEGGTVLGRRRKYSLARYLVDLSGAASPLTLFKAMAPLKGLTKEMASSLIPVRAANHAPAEEEVAADPFLRQALTCIISGIPLRIKAGETEFFRLIDLVWQTLPAKIRPLLSAGWNVSSSSAAELAIFSGVASSERCAQYSAGAWSPLQASVKSIAAGQLYASLSFPSPGGQDQALAEKYLYSSELPTGRSLPALSSVPAFHDPGVLSRFEYAGLSILEDTAVGRLRDWLETGSPALSNQLMTLIGRIYARSELTDLIKCGLANVRQRQRADQLAWAFLSGRNLLYAEGDRPHAAGAYRGALLQAVSRQDAGLALDTLLSAALADEADGLPPEVITRVEGLLTSTFDQVKTHFGLLQNLHFVNFYGFWAKNNAVDLAFAFAADPSVAKPGLEKLQHLFGEDTLPGALAVIGNVVSGKHHTQRDRAILLKLGPPDRAKFCSLLGTIWGQVEGWDVDREVLLDWCADVPSEDYGDPALVLASGGTITHVQIAMLVKQGIALPRRLMPRLSQAALYAFRDLRPLICKDPAAWAPLVSLWPREVALTLLGPSIRELPQSVHPTDTEIARDFSPDAKVIQDCLEDWLLSPVKPNLLLDAIPVIWNWITALGEPEDGRLMAVEICWCLARRRFVKDSEISHTPYDETQLATTLARFSGHYEELAKDAFLLWKSALQGWQLKLLLELFPQIEFSPSTDQLVALIPFRTWLQSHLERKRVAAGRRAAFQIAASDFQSISYPGKEHEKWREEWRDRVLVAAYRGCPFGQPPLPDVFQAYASTSAQRVQICLGYLAAASSAEDFEDTVKRVLMDFLFPAAMQAGLTAEQLINVVRAAGDSGSKGLIQVAINSSGQPFEQRSSGVIVLADYMIVLLWCIVRRGYSSMMQKYIDKHYATLAGLRNQDLKGGTLGRR